MKFSVKNLGLSAFIMAVIVGLDQLTKHLVRTYISFSEAIPSHGFFQLVHAENTGAAFSIFQNSIPILIVTSSLALIVIAVIALSHQFRFLENTWGRIGLGLAAGGTAGNLIDRAYYGFVTDFLKAGPWPAFNVADSAVVVGMILMAFLYLRSGQAAGR
ncbi:signal peptidase II [Dehalogenimonas formicexedens]|uniref:signal peptidase II n=1 Tax=Dehalogenimonas formicexedens TaxID=1839801 RepID=UPI001313FE78|nr:signal peptidase II [Dehalogenimonas formicexedens]